MSILTYKPPGFAAAINLGVVDTRTNEWEAVKSSDGTSYLYTKVTIEVIAQFNPRMVSYAAGPVAQAGNTPMTTERAIRDALLKPRGTLTFTVGGVEMLRSPVAGTTVDVANGPIPIFCNVSQIHGQKTFVVHYKIETYINKCTEKPVVLSHRWKAQADTDEDYFTMRVIEGEAVFRTDQLLLLGRIPDDYRRSFFHPVPANMQRESSTVIADPDGRTVHYRLVDREKAFAMNNILNCTRVECYQTHFFSEAGAGYIASTLSPEMPKFNWHVLVRVWGHRNHRRAMLERIALEMAFARIGYFTPGIRGELTIAHQVDGKFVEVQWFKKAGSLEGIFGGGDNVTKMRRWLRPECSDDGLATAGEEGNIAATGLSMNAGAMVFTRNGLLPLMPSNNATRGTYLEKIVSQALETPCEVPPAMPRNQRANDLTWG